MKAKEVVLMLWIWQAMGLAWANSHSAFSIRTTVDTRGGVQTATLNLTVRDGTSDLLLPGASVNAGGTPYTTDVSGRATIANAADGTALTISKLGYSPLNTVCRVGGVGAQYQTERLAPVLGTTTKPIINSAVVRPFAFALQASVLNIPLFIIPDVSWGTGTGGKINWKSARTSGSVNKGVNDTVLKLNPTLDLPASGVPIPKVYTVTLVAETSAGQSPPLTKEVIGVAAPLWLQGGGRYLGPDTPVAKELNQCLLSFNGKLIPEEIGEFDIKILTIECSLDVFAEGWLGMSMGETSGARGTYSIEGGLDGGIKVLVNGALPGGIKPYGSINAEGKLAIGGEWLPVQTGSGTLDLKVRGAIGVVVPVRTILLADPTGCGQAFNAWVGAWPDLAKLIDETAYLDASVGAHVAAKLPVGLCGNFPYIYSDPSGATYGLGSDVKLKGHIGYSVFYIEGLLGGSGTFWFRGTPEGDTFDHAEFKIEGALTAGFLQFELAFPTEITVVLPDAKKMAVLPAPSDLSRSSSGSMRLISRDYAARPDGGRFVMGVQDVKARQLAAGDPAPLGTVRSEVFVQDVFPNTTAAVAGPATNDATVLFSYDNTNLIQVQAMDIYCTRWNGSSWSAPAPVATNTQTELHPQVAMDAGNRPVGVWMRMRTTNFTNLTDVTNYLAQFDIVASSHALASNAWAAAQVISSNQCLNFDPRLVRAPSGALAAWWQSNPANQLEGGTASSSNAPTQWWWARWDPAQLIFTNSIAIDTNIVGALGANLVYGGTNAWLLWAQDQDRDYATSNDTALCYRYWDGSAWSATTVATAPGQVVTAVSAVMLTNGNPLVVWWQNGDLVYAQGPNFRSVKTARTNSAGLASQRLNLAASSDNRYVLLVFPVTTFDGMNLAYRVYDVAADTWGGDFAFESTNTLDFSMAPAFIGNQMWAAYTRGILAYSNKTVDVGTTNIVLSNIPYRVRTDLMLAKFELDTDVAVTRVEVPATYPPVMEVDVANEGDTIISNLVVDVREGSISGALLGSLTMGTPLLPHTMETLILPGSIYSNSATRVLTAVVDPVNAISEFRESNNSISNRVLGTQVQIAGLAQERGAGGTNVWIVQARNPIGRPISNATARVRLQATNGTIAASAATNLPAFETTELRLLLPTAGLTNGTILVTELAVSAAAGETNSTLVYLSTSWAPDAETVPAMPTDFRFLRPGVSNSLAMGWVPPASTHDGVRVVRIVGTNTPEEIGFEEVPGVAYTDAQVGGITQVAYRVAAYNGLAVGPLSSPISTNIVPADANIDGLPDAWQIAYFGSMTNPLASWNSDSDNDGYPNWKEYQFGSHPTNGADYPLIFIENDGAGNTHIIWTGADGQPYGIDSSTDVNNWLPLMSGVVGSNGMNSIQVLPSLGGIGTQGFFRVHAP